MRGVWQAVQCRRHARNGPDERSDAPGRAHGGGGVPLVTPTRPPVVPLCARDPPGEFSRKMSLTATVFFDDIPSVPQRPRGRPLKFGRPSRLVALTLPQDLVEDLRHIDPDLGWAIVSLHERTKTRIRRRMRRREPPPVDLVQLSSGASLIVVDPRALRDTSGIAVVPMTPDRAFLAFEDGRGLGDLQLAIAQRLRSRRASSVERRILALLHRRVRTWRRSRQLRFARRSIILLERATRTEGDAAALPRRPRHHGPPGDDSPARPARSGKAFPPKRRPAQVG